jgi:protoporphyrinogen oxidase
MKTIIVGAGIAGLWLADKLADAGHIVTVLEKEDRLGGRILTSAKHGYEIGAGRIDLDGHHLTMDLIKRFGLKTFEHGKGSLWSSVGSRTLEPNNFAETWAPLVALFSKLDPVTLGSTTLRDLAVSTIGCAATNALLLRFPYRAETETLRADLAIKSFQAEMSDKPRFGGVAGGLSSITTALAASARKAGARIHVGVTVTDVNRSPSSGRYSVLTSDGKHRYADRVILAVPVTALRSFPCLQSVSLLSHLTMKPLTRIYAQMETAWCPPKRIITDSPLRYIIPIKPKEGIVMISYTESQDTQRYMSLEGEDLKAALHQDLRQLFPDQPVPRIVWARAYEWSDGCSYWLPGSYDVVAASAKALQPLPDMPDLHLVGESFCLRQAWIEGALEHAADLLLSLNRNSA